MACRQVLPKDRLVDLLTDMYLYDEEFAKGIQGADSVSFYRSVFVKHGCREEEYKQAIACYAKKPKVMKEIYEAVKARLESYKAEFEQALQVEDSLRNLWVSPYDTLFQNTGIPPRSYAFSIPVDTLCVYTLSLSVQYFEDDSTRRPRMKGYLLGKFGEKDTIRKKDAIQGKKKQLNRELAALELTQDLKPQKNLKKAKLNDVTVKNNHTIIKNSDLVVKSNMADTVRQEKEVEFARGETKTYTLSFTVDDTLVTHIRGFWLLTDEPDSTAQQHIYLSKFRVHKPRNTPPPLVLKAIEHFQPVP
jgi:hypothetical protein